MVGWAKSFPVSIGRPGLRLVTTGIETALLLPLVLVLGLHWGATGAAVALLVSSLVIRALLGLSCTCGSAASSRRCRARPRRSRVSRLYDVPSVDDWPGEERRRPG